MRDVVALCGSCSLGTAPFVPTLVYAAVEAGGVPARAVAVLARDGWGASVGLGDAAGRGYCWRCGDDGHAKSACPRRGEGGGGSRASGGGGYGTQVAGDGRDVSGGGGGKSGAAAAAAADDISDHIRGLSVG